MFTLMTVGVISWVDSSVRITFLRFGQATIRVRCAHSTLAQGRGRVSQADHHRAHAQAHRYRSGHTLVRQAVQSRAASSLTTITVYTLVRLIVLSIGGLFLPPKRFRIALLRLLAHVTALQKFFPICHQVLVILFV